GQIRTDPSAHLRSRAVQIRLQFRNREAGNLRDLFVSSLLKNFQSEDQPFVLVQRRERVSNDSAQFFVQKLIDRRQLDAAQVQNRLVLQIDIRVVAHSRSY